MKDYLLFDSEEDKEPYGAIKTLVGDCRNKSHSLIQKVFLSDCILYFVTKNGAVLSLHSPKMNLYEDFAKKKWKPVIKALREAIVQYDADIKTDPSVLETIQSEVGKRIGFFQISATEVVTLTLGDIRLSRRWFQHYFKQRDRFNAGIYTEEELSRCPTCRKLNIANTGYQRDRFSCLLHRWLDTERYDGWRFWPGTVLPMAGLTSARVEIPIDTPIEPETPLEYIEIESLPLGIPIQMTEFSSYADIQHEGNRLITLYQNASQSLERDARLGANFRQWAQTSLDQLKSRITALRQQAQDMKDALPDTSLEDDLQAKREAMTAILESNAPDVAKRRARQWLSAIDCEK